MIFQKKNVKVSFNIDTDQLIISQYNDKKWSLINKYAYLEDISIKQYQKKEGKITQGQFDIFFSPNGNSSGGIITLSNKKNRIYEIEVDSITGNARIRE